jgi:hypothetical protein
MTSLTRPDRSGCNHTPSTLEMTSDKDSVPTPENSHVLGREESSDDNRNENGDGLTIEVGLYILSFRNHFW